VVSSFALASLSEFVTKLWYRQFEKKNSMLEQLHRQTCGPNDSSTEKVTTEFDLAAHFEEEIRKLAPMINWPNNFSIIVSYT
jgi:hypothetical protein